MALLNLQSRDTVSLIAVKVNRLFAAETEVIPVVGFFVTGRFVGILHQSSKVVHMK
jgi:hypothetical protein